MDLTLEQRWFAGVYSNTGGRYAKEGHDTQALQHYLGHRNIQQTVRYTAIAPDRLKGFWKD